MLIFKTIFIIIPFLFVCGNSHSQIEQSIKDSLINHLDELLSDEWFLNETENGFNVYFCRSCKIKHEEYLFQDEWTNEKMRNDFFSLEDLDSVSYFPTVSMSVINWKNSEEEIHQEKLEIFKANGILSFEISFEKKWDLRKFDSINRNNELLKVEILKEPLYKTSSNIFSDYRFYLPPGYLSERTKEYDFYFQRLPYSTDRLSYSVFIVSDKPYFFCEALYVDKNDPKYYTNKSNFLESERNRALKIIALALGIYDFKILN